MRDKAVEKTFITKESNGWKAVTQCWDDNDDGICGGPDDYEEWETFFEDLDSLFLVKGGGTHRGWAYNQLVEVYLDGKKIWTPDNFFEIFPGKSDEEILKLIKYKGSVGSNYKMREE